MIITVALFAMMLSSCSMIELCFETEKKFKNAPTDYPNLIPVTVNEMKAKLETDGKEYKIVYLYDACDDEYGKYISETIMPYVARNAGSDAAVYAVNQDCGWLKEIEGTLKEHKIDLPPYYFRDNSPEFISYGKNRVTDRRSQIAKRIFTNTDAIGDVLTHNTCYLANSENKVKLVRYTCPTKQGEKSILLPCPLERITEPMNEVDFDEVLEVTLTGNEREAITYFDEYNK